MILRLAHITLRAVKESLAPLSKVLHSHRKRTLAILALSATFIALLGFAALAGQGPSQWCDDGAGNTEQSLIHDPVTVDVEYRPNWVEGAPVPTMVCYSTTPYGSGGPEVTGGAISIGSSPECRSDPAALVRVDCSVPTSVNVFSLPIASAAVGGQVTILGTPVPIPGMGVQAGCADGYAVTTSGVQCSGSPTPCGYAVTTSGVRCTNSGGSATRPSESCANEGGPPIYSTVNYYGIHDPVTLGIERASTWGYVPFVGDVPLEWSKVCYSTAPYGSSDPELAGGSAQVGQYWANNPSVSCISDPNATVRVDCSAGVFTPGDSWSSVFPDSGYFSYVGYYGDPAGYHAGGQVTVLGNPVPVPESSVQAGIDCASGTIAVSVVGCANGQVVGVSGIGPASGGVLGLSGTGNEGGWLMFGTSPQCAQGGIIAISGLGQCSSGGLVALSALGSATASGYQIAPGVSPGVGVGARNASGSTVAVSGTGTANGGTADLSICGGAVAVFGQTFQSYGLSFSTVDSATDQVFTTTESLPGDDEVSTVMEPTSDAPIPDAEEVVGIGLSLVNSCMNANPQPPAGAQPEPASLAETLSSETSSSETSSSSNGLPSCRGARIRGDAGYVEFQRDPSSGSVAWGAYHWNGNEDYGWWYVEWFQNDKRRGKHSKSYPPHHSFPAQYARPGNVLTVMGWHNAYDRWYRVGGQCRVPR